MSIPNSKIPFRVWVNQPSTLQTYHHLNGQNFLAIHEYDDTYCIYFLSGTQISQQISRLALSLGWRGHAN